MARDGHGAEPTSGLHAESFREMAERATDVLYRADGEGRVAWISAGVVDVLGWDRDDLLGTRMIDLIHPDDLEHAQLQRDRLIDGEIRGGPLRTAVTRFRTKAGEYRPMSVRASVSFDEAGRPTGGVVGFRLVEELVEALRRAEDDEELLRVSMDAVPDPLVLVSCVRDAATGEISDFRYLNVNEATCEYLATPRSSLIGKDLLELFPGYADAGLFDLYAAAASSDAPTVVDGFPYANEILGEVRYYDIRARRVSRDRLSVTWRDVTDRQRAAQRLTESEERYRMIAEGTADVVMRSRNNTVTWVSPSLTRTLGWSTGDWIGHSLAEFGHPDDLQTVADARDAMQSGSTVLMRIRFADIAGDWHWAEVHSRVFVDADGQPDGFVSSFRIVDDQISAQQELERLARFDQLTGVLNRQEILRKLSGISASARRPHQHTAVLFCDIDRFKAINDTHGHAAGDEVLRTLAERIRSVVRDDDHVARIGGDELLVILTSVHSLDDATAVANKILDAARISIVAEAGASTTLSIGVTLMRPGEDVDSLIARADQAMYDAKQQGRNRVVAVDQTA